MDEGTQVLDPLAFIGQVVAALLGPSRRNGSSTGCLPLRVTAALLRVAYVTPDTGVNRSRPCFSSSARRSRFLVRHASPRRPLVNKSDITGADAVGNLGVARTTRHHHAPST